MPVGGGDDGSVGEDFDAGVGGVPALLVVHDADDILARAVLHDVLVAADPGGPVALSREGALDIALCSGAAGFGATTEADEEASVRSVNSGVSVAGEGDGHFARGGPSLAFVVGEDDVGIFAAGVFAEEDAELFAIGGAEDAGLAEVDLAGLIDRLGSRPSEAAVLGECFVEGHDGRFLSFAVFREKASVVVKEGQVVSGSGLKCRQAAHGDDAAPVADGVEFAPSEAIVFGDGHADGIEAGEHDDAFLSLGIDDAMEGGDFLGGGPGFGGGQAIAPGESAVAAPFVDDGATAVAFGIDAEHRLAVFHEAGGGVAEILAVFTIDHDLTLGIGGEVDEGDCCGRWGFCREVEARSKEQQGRERVGEGTVHGFNVRNFEQKSSGNGWYS